MGLGDTISNVGSAVSNRVLGTEKDAQGVRWAHASLAQATNQLPSKVPQDSNWVYSSQIESERWDQQYPYQLQVVEAKAPASANAQNISTPDASSQVSYVPRPDWRFTLPITPEDITMETNFSIVVTALMTGIVRESNGARFRRIQFNGTTGVLPLRGAAEQAKTMNLAEAVFSGTIQAAGKLASAATSLVDGGVQESNLVSDDELTTGTLGGKGTGYYQFRLLQQFLESYAAAISSPQGRNLRLALCMWKDQAVYLVEPEPNGFRVRKDARSPYEYRYELSFKAYKRVDIGAQEAPFDEFVPVAHDPNAMATVLDTLDKAREILSDAKDVISSVVSDVDQLFEPLRQAILFVKDAVGVSLAAADLPANLISEMKQPVIDLMGAQQFAVDAKAAFNGVPASTRAALADLQNSIRQFSQTTSKATTGAGNLTDQSQALQNSAHPVHQVFSHPDEHQQFFRALKPTALRLSPMLARKIREERDRVRALTRLDWENMRDRMVQVLANFEEAVGQGSESYNKTYNRKAKGLVRQATADDWDVIFAINSSLLQFNKLAASGTITKTSGNAIEYFAGLANRSGISFTLPRSKYAVPFPLGSTLERVAARYLGNPDRWMEIAVLNGLQSPYVDEVGLDRPLLTAGNGNQIVISDSSNLYIGQPVWISSSSTSRERRRITDIRDLGFNQVVLTLDGDPTLSKYTPLAGAAIHAYLPNTVNSQMLLYLPSQVDPGNADLQTKSIPGVDFYDRMMRVGGVDLLLTSNNDIAITPDGDVRLAVGLTNIIQQVRIGLGIVRGELIRHPTFGLGITPGTSIADLSPNKLLASARELFRNNPSFSGIESAAISLQGPVASIAISVGIAGTDQFLPVTVDVQQ